METIGLILAAGRGSRMHALTEDKPKCLLPLAGKPLLHWQLDALHAAGLQRIAVVRGYKAECLSGNFETVENPCWESSNMVRSLLCAFSAFPGHSFLVSYSDIVYRPEHVFALLHCQSDMALSYDQEWQSLWELRNENPLDDAETFREQNGRLVEIGGKPLSLAEVNGQYMGLLFFSPAGVAAIKRHLSKEADAYVDTLDMTSLLRALLSVGEYIAAIPVQGGWCECDTQTDIEKYEQRLTNRGWMHDWRFQL